jgi:hypothetical protein
MAVLMASSAVPAFALMPRECPDCGLGLETASSKEEDRSRYGGGYDAVAFVIDW